MLIKKRRKFWFFLSKIRYRLRDNQIYFLFSRQFHIEFVRIKQAGYKKKGSYQTHNKIGKKDKVSRPDPLNDASIRYSDI
jgi:hypothetical protein